MMEKPGHTITVHSTDDELNSLLRQHSDAAPSSQPLPGHYSHNEDFFLQLPSSFRVPSFPIHHDIEDPRPPAAYRKAMLELLDQVVPQVPLLFRGLAFFFNPADTDLLNLYQLYRIKDDLYLYLVQIDLSFKPLYCSLEQKGGNDATHAYRSDKLFLEPLLIPLADYREEQGRIRSFSVQQHISQTWVGERGKGYFVQGIWIDRDLTKFFSKLFLPTGLRSYPYYPFPCKYRTICHAILDYSVEGRKRHLGLLYHAQRFLKPHFQAIQEELTHQDFSEELPLFTSIKKKVPERWNEVRQSLEVKAYLNEQDMKEFKLAFTAR